MKVSTAGRLYRIRLYRYMMNKLQRDSMLHIHWAAVACILWFWVSWQEMVYHMTVFTSAVELHLHSWTFYISKVSQLSFCNSLCEQAAHTFLARHTAELSASPLQLWWDICYTMPSAILQCILVITPRTAKAFSNDLQNILHQQLDAACDADTILEQKATGTEK